MNHRVVSFTLNVTFPSCAVTKNILPVVHNFAKADWAGLNNFLIECNWNVLFASCTTIADFWDTFVDVISLGINMFVPIKVNTNRNRSRNFPKHIRKLLLVLKRAAWRKYKRFKTVSLLTKYKQIYIRCSHAINDFIATYENNLISHGNLSSFYRYVNDKLNGSNEIAPLKSPNGEFIFDDTKKANLLNEYFGSVYTIDNDLVDFSSLSSEQYT